MSSHASTTDVTDLSISTFHAALREGRTSISAVVDAYLARITRCDPVIKSIITLNPNALNDAAKKDLETRNLLDRSGNNTITTTSSTAALPFPPLHGVPILLKDNYTTKDLPTSAGCKALASLTSSNDSDVVTHLLQAGAIILGKANLHEFALHGTTTSSLGGQTLNPYDLTRTPGGSSGGTGAGLALNLAMVGCGTDTVNSLRSPASACSIVGFRPSVERISCEGIVPVSLTQDVAGPMGRCVADVRILFDVMKGSGRSIGSEELQRKPDTMPGGQREFRVGILEEYFHLEESPSNSSDAEILAENKIVQDVVRNALSLCSSSPINITFIPIPRNTQQTKDWSVSTLLSKADTQAFEFRECLNNFLASESIISPHNTLESIAESGDYDKKAVTDVFTLPLTNKEEYSRASEEYKSRLTRISTLKDSVNNIFHDLNLDALIYPHQRHLPIKIGPTIQPGRNGILAALTGRPAICIPAGFSPATNDAVQGVPIGLELMGREDEEERLLDLAEAMEGVIQARKEPSLLNN